MVDRMEIEQVARQFKAMSDPVRLSILSRLRQDQRETCSVLLKDFEIAQSTFSYHVSELVEAGLVVAEPEGRVVRLSLNPESIEKIRYFLDDLGTKNQSKSFD